MRVIFIYQLCQTGSARLCQSNTATQLTDLSKWRDASRPLFVQFDLSVFETSLGALCDYPRLGGCDLETVAQWLSALGQHEASAIMLTGLNPNRPGMGVVKVGQRLMVTALLAFIYARLGFGIDHPGSPNLQGKCTNMTATITTFHPPLSQPGFRLFDGPLCDVADVSAGQIGVVGMPSDWTHSSRLGTRFGP
jgi:agmatinase